MKINLFVFGMPRSGTKLLRELLNSNPSIFIPEAESQFFPFLFKKYGSIIDFSSEKIKNQFISDIKNSLFIFYLKTEFDYNTNLDYLNNKKEKEKLSDILTELFLNFCEKKHVKYLGDKTPEYLIHTELLFEEFPNSKYIHLVRDPRDYVLSMNKAWGKNIYLAATKWNEYITNFQAKKKKLGANLIEIKYEDLISETEKTLKDICNFLEIDFNKNMLTPNKSVENKGDAIGQNKVKKDNFNKFLNQLSKSQILELEQIAFIGMQEYGYQILNSDSITQSKKPHKIKLKLYRIQDIFAVAFDAFKIYGIKNGLKKLIFSQKQFATKN
ncbi:sulfotransferase family protein [Shivajiella indica]|uniref:Sulfotransferase family protein n=1 Tax=Shivajiella indica TaxID=872115 RepID=A0ABW5BAZ8_9BACT